MFEPDRISLGTSTRPEYPALNFGDWRGLVTGATGTERLGRSVRNGR